MDYTNESRFFVRRGRIIYRIVQFFNKYIDSLQTVEEKGTAVRMIIESMKNRSFMTRVAYFHYVKIISTFNVKNVLHSENLEHFESMLEKHVKYQYVIEKMQKLICCRTYWTNVRQNAYILEIVLKLGSFKALDKKLVMKLFEKIHPSVFDEVSMQNDIVAWLSEDVCRVTSLQLH